MAARWGVGEDCLTTGNMEFFSTYALDQGGLSEGSDGLAQLESGGGLESFHGSLDPSILCIFEDSTSTGEAKSRLDDESEATLLTALTEILDNVDDENLSPFDTLPDSDLFSGQKGREQSPLRRLLSLARSPPYREPARGPKSASFTTGKSEGVHQKARVPLRAPDTALQRSDGEEEEEAGGSLGPCSESDEDPASPEGGVPLNLDQDGEGVPVSLSDLVRHMHPYCLAVSLEPGETEGGAPLLPEGGIVLEVVDRGEQGEPILAVAPELTFPEALPTEDGAAGFERGVAEEEVFPNAGAVNKGAPYPAPNPEEGSEGASEERPKGDTWEKCPTGRKKKRKNGEDKGGGEGLEEEEEEEEEGPVELLEAPSETAQTLKQKKRVTFAPVLTSFLDAPIDDGSQNKEPLLSALGEQEGAVLGKPANTGSEERVSDTSMAMDCNTASVQEGAPASQQVDPKPRPLSLQQYRILRQQKKLAPVEKQEDHSTKWPTLPEPPTELPPIPCLLEPQHVQHSRRWPPQPTTRTSPNTASTWQPVGPAAPPTPKALLVPPGSVVSSSEAAATSARPGSVTKVMEGSQNPSCSPGLNPAPLLANSSKWPDSKNRPELGVGQPQNPTAASHQSPPSGTHPPALAASGPARCSGVTEGIPEQGPLGHPGAGLSVSIPPQSHALPAEALAPHPPTTQTTALTQKPQPSPCPTKKGVPPKHPPIPAAPVPGLAAQGRPPKVAQKNLTPVQMPSSVKRGPKERIACNITSDIGIEATDLTSLLEQFEETQANEKPGVPEVCGRAAAVGSSSLEQQRLRGPDLGSTAGLTPPATPPHQIWKPLTPVALLGRTKQPEGLKPSPAKAIQIINPRPLPGNGKPRSKCPLAATPSQPATPIALKEAPAFMDHDYCLPPEGPSVTKRQQPVTAEKSEGPSISAAAKGIKPTTPGITTTTTTAPGKFVTQPLDHRTLAGSVLLSPDTSPCRLEADTAASAERGPRNKSRGALRFLEHSPSPRPGERGRAKRRYRTRSPSSDSGSSGSSSRSSSRSQSSSRSTSRSHSRSSSRSPPRKRFRSHRSDSSSSSSSRSSSHSLSRSPHRRDRHRSRGSYVGTRHSSWSRSRSRSRSPQDRRHRWWRGSRSPTYRCRYRYDSRERCRSQDVKDRKEKAIEERRVVYVGRIRGGMTRKELKERFSQYGEIEECTLHFREYGDNYGFVTYYNTKDAFTAIENGSKLRQSDELPFDLCFGGRRQFCKSSYADLDSNRDFDPVPKKSKFDALDFDTLLRQAQRGLKR
ncbi:peroxisome proliferator-activated receptor gamma coactivator-related protein 1-like [Megalops cyprinoides]|uniref:peroxisome proliferator-activated receptor gamma coactivator-related protein 1-like n=1 Tax=Megalops cyprinoides TaxID=118141 RepID=UPI001863C90B|nr:peroxisome proliferator-activated receptor gamma coactivator-related protein 1-like [Megalops cyprinoides]